MKSNQTVRRLWIGAAWLAVSCGGCRTWWEQPKPSSSGSPAENKPWTEQMRPATGDDVPTGTSTKAREIERNLGYR